MRQWTPAQEGANFEFSSILKPLEDFRKRRHGPHQPVELRRERALGQLGDVAERHVPVQGQPAEARAPRSTRSSPRKSGGDTTFPSMEFATEDHSSHLGSCAGDFLCSYMSTISWASPTQPLPMEINPRVVFERMFGGDRATPEERRARLEKQHQHPRRGARERERPEAAGSAPATRCGLTEYLDNVREIERRIVQAEQQRTRPASRRRSRPSASRRTGKSTST